MGKSMFSSIRKIYQDDKTFRAMVLLVMVILLVGTLVVNFSTILWPFLTAIILSSWLDSFMPRLRKIGIPRRVGAACSVACVVIVMLTTLLIVSFLLQKYVLAYSSYLPKVITFLAEWIPQKLHEFETRVHIPLDINDEQIQSFLVNSLGNLSEIVLRYASSLYAGAKSVVGFVSFLFFVPILTFYLLKDWPSLVVKTRHFLNEQVLAFADFALPRAKEALRRQIHGQVKVCGAVFVLYSAALAIIGIKPYLVLGFLSALLTLIPFIGIFLAFVVSFIVAINQGLGWPPLLSVALLYFLGSSLESNFLTPKWVGKELGVHPIWMFFAVLFILSWLGLAGAFFILPLVALSWSFIQSTYLWLKKSEPS